MFVPLSTGPAEVGGVFGMREADRPKVRAAGCGCLQPGPSKMLMWLLAIGGAFCITLSCVAAVASLIAAARRESDAVPSLKALPSPLGTRRFGSAYKQALGCRAGGGSLPARDVRELELSQIVCGGKRGSCS